MDIVRSPFTFECRKSFGTTSQILGVEMAGFNRSAWTRKHSARAGPQQIEKADARHKRDLFGKRQFGRRRALRNFRDSRLLIRAGHGWSFERRRHPFAER